MKQTLCIISLFAVLSIACNKVELNTDDNQVLTNKVTAVAEQSEIESKATVSGNYEILWAGDDYLHAVIYRTEGNYDPWETSLKFDTYNSTPGSTTATFVNANEGSWNAYTESMDAIYPEYDNNFGRNKTHSYAHIQYRTAYDYSTGVSFAPMVSYQSMNLHFKHVGGIVEIKVKNIPAFADKVSMTMDKNITGWKNNFDVSLAGTGEITSSELAGTANTELGKTVSYSINPSENTQDLTFFFPVPVVTTPKITLDVYNGSENLFSKSTKSAQASIGRGQLLKMKDLNAAPADGRWVTVAVQTDWGIHEYKLHHWPSGVSGSDESLTSTGTTCKKTFGEHEYTFNLFVAKVPTNDLIKVHLGDEWYGADGEATKTKVYLYNDGSNQVVYE